LGVTACSSAPEADIRKAYRQKLLALHTDKVAQCRQAAKCLHVQEAYAVLMDPEQWAISCRWFITLPVLFLDDGGCHQFGRLV